MSSNWEEDEDVCMEELIHSHGMTTIKSREVDGDQLRLRIESQTNRAIFWYTLGPDVTFQFDLLCEVKEGFVSTFAEMVMEAGFRLEISEGDEHYYQVLQRDE